MRKEWLAVSTSHLTFNISTIDALQRQLEYAPANPLDPDRSRKPIQKRTDGCSTKETSFTGAQLVSTENSGVNVFWQTEINTSWVVRRYANDQVRNKFVVASFFLRHD